MDPILLDLGAGPTSPPGYLPLGNGHGPAPIFPLPHADGSVDVIRASHVLEHFPHGQVGAVIADWVRALKPGGVLRIAVPDFARIAEGYAAGDPRTQGYVMGGQVDAADFHKAIFDRDLLRAAMAAAGLVLLRPWRSELEDCAALPVSLNVEGTKPRAAQPAVRGVMTAPRLGFNDMWSSALQSLPRLGVEFTDVRGAFWDQCIEQVMERALDDPCADGRLPDYLLAMDYDSVFHAGHVATLIQLAMVHPDVDAIAPMQSGRHKDGVLLALPDPARLAPGQQTVDVDAAELEADLYRRPNRAHFGLTLVKAAKLRALPHPWFRSTPNAQGRWSEGKTDADIHFWKIWEAAGNTLAVAPRVVIGHLELMVRWPSAADLKPMWQTAKDWGETRQPPPGTWTGY